MDDQAERRDLHADGLVTEVETEEAKFRRHQSVACASPPLQSPEDEVLQPSEDVHLKVETVERVVSTVLDEEEHQVHQVRATRSKSSEDDEDFERVSDDFEDLRLKRVSSSTEDFERLPSNGQASFESLDDACSHDTEPSVTQSEENRNLKAEVNRLKV
jgi:hypothetical protein